MAELTPRQIVRELDRYIVGQDEAKRAFFKQKTAYEIHRGDWSLDVCSSDLLYA